MMQSTRTLHFSVASGIILACGLSSAQTVPATITQNFTPPALQASVACNAVWADFTAC